VCVVCRCEKKKKKSERKKSEKVSVCEKVEKKVGVVRRDEKGEKKSVCEVERVCVGRGKEGGKREDKKKCEKKKFVKSVCERKGRVRVEKVKVKK
jgi:hypothetical protein